MYWNEYFDELECREFMININMRCIEILLSGQVYAPWQWLTLTWDVLKCIKVFITGIDVIRLTLTWDVLKYGICNVKEFELLD